MARLVTRVKGKDGREFTGQFKLWQHPSGAPIAMKDDGTGVIIPWHAIEFMVEGEIDVVLADPGVDAIQRFKG